jgi:DNA-binding NarL/FixJ family response regulator
MNARSRCRKTSGIRQAARHDIGGYEHDHLVAAGRGRLAPPNRHNPNSATRPHTTVRIVIVDDRDLVRHGIKTMLSGEREVEVVGEAANGREVLEVCRDVRPHLVLMDIRMPDTDSATTTRAIKQQLPDVSVLILTAYENQDYLLEAIQAGADGYMLKDAPRSQLITAIRKVLNGEIALTRELATQLLKRLVNEVSGARRGSKQRAELPATITPREREVIELLALGWTNRRIAQDLVISAGTAKRHVENIMTKLGVPDRTQAVVRALELGIITPPER